MSEFFATCLQLALALLGFALVSVMVLVVGALLYAVFTALTGGRRKSLPQPPESRTFFSSGRDE